MTDDHRTKPAAIPASDTEDTGAAAPATEGGGVPAAQAYMGSSSAELPVRNRGRYQTLGVHGRGGLGVVRRARDDELGRIVALKELRRRGPLADARFVREATITARLEHPGIVPVYEAGRWPDGTPFYAMKLVAGRPLSSLIAEARTLPARLALVPHVIAVADAIAYAHSRGILHRDLKPANVIVGEFGETVVIDWGLAKDISESSDDELVAAPYHASTGDELTITGTTLGTPAYMAPEQAASRPCEASDIYSIGAILFTVATGRPPMPQGVAPRTGPRDLAAIIERACATEVRARYASARDLADDLRRFLGREPVAARRYRPLERLLLAAARNRQLAALAALSLVAITLLSLIGAAMIDRQRGRAMDAEARARAAQRAAEAHVADLTLSNARLFLATDPTAAIDVLDGYRGDDATAAGLIRAEAMALGVAASRLRSHSDGVVMLAGTRSGQLISMGEDPSIQVTSLTASVGASGLLTSDVTAAVLPAYSAAADRLIYVSASGALVARAVAGGSGAIVSVGLSPSPPRRVSMSLSGEHVAVLHQDGSIAVWRPGRDDAVVVLGRVLDAFAVIARDDRVIVVTANRLVGLPLDGSRPSVERQVAMPAVAHAVDSTGERLALGFADGRVQRWSLRDLTAEPARAVCATAVKAVSVESPRWLAYACVDRAAGALDATTGARVALVLDTPARHIAIDAAGRLLVIGTMQGVVHVHDLLSGFSQDLRGHQAQLAHVLAPSPELPYVVTSDDKGEVRLWPAPRWPGWHVSPVGQRSFHAWFGAAGSRLIASGASGLVRLWDLPRGHCVVLPGHRDLIHVLRISPDGRRAVTGGYDATARLWDLETGRSLGVLSEHHAAVVDAEFLDDETLVVAGADGQVVAWWPAQARHQLLYRDRLSIVLIEPLAAIDSVAATTADGRVLMVGRDGHVREVAAATGLGRSALRASPDGALLALGDARGQVTLLDPRSDRLTPVTRLSHGIRHIVFDPAASRLAIASEHGELAVVSLGAKPVVTLDVPEARTRFVAFRGDGRVLAAAGRDGALRLLALDGLRWSVLRLYPADVTSVHFSPDGGRLVTTSIDGQISLVDPPNAFSGAASLVDAGAAPAPMPTCKEGLL